MSQLPLFTPAPDALAEALRHRAAAEAHLRQRLDERVAILRRSLARSRVPAEAAVVAQKLDELLARAGSGGGARFLALCRALSGLEQSLQRAEAQVDADGRRAREALGRAGEHLAQVAPALSRAFLPLLQEIPADAGLPERIPALLALLRARRVAVPHLFAARPQWKR